MQTNKAVPIKDYYNSLHKEYLMKNMYWLNHSKDWNDDEYNYLMRLSNKLKKIKNSIEQGVKWYIPH